MDWSQVLMIIGSNAALFFWARSESRADIRHMDTKLEMYRQETNTMIKAIQDEIKDFHNRLCKIEERK